MTTNNIDISSIDMNTVEDLEGFELPPAGSYTAALSLAVKDINGENKLEWTYTIVDAIELDDPSAEVPANAKFSTLSDLKPKNLKYSKHKCTILAESLGISANLGDIVENVQNVEVTCILKHKPYKDKVYADVPNEGFAVN